MYPNRPNGFVMGHTPVSNQLNMAINNTPNRNYPPVNINKLEISVKEMQKIVQQVQLLVNKIANSEQFAQELMHAAQISDKETINRLIRSTGITIHFETKYTPDGLRIDFIESNCCSLRVILSW